MELLETINQPACISRVHLWHPNVRKSKDTYTYSFHNNLPLA